jgi:hypothetical protein
MKWVALCLAIFSAMTGLLAARKWYDASKVNFVSYEEVNGKIVEVPTSDVEIWIGNLRRTLKKSGLLNESAALWTAVSVALAGLSSLAGALSD